MARLAAVDLTPTQVRIFKKVYADGEMTTEMMLNLFNFMPIPPAFGLMGLCVPRLEPSHFPFTGNRPYLVQVVSNGSCFAVLSQQRMPKKNLGKPTLNVARMEVLMSANLPFLKIQPPTERQLRQLHADFIQWAVEGFEDMTRTWPEELRDLPLSMARGPLPTPDPARDQILAGIDPAVVLAQWIEAGDPDRELVRAVPLANRFRP